MNLNGKEYFYIRNVQNDVIGLHDSTGTVVVSYSYDTWGNIVSITGSLKDSVGKKNPYRYRGYRYDEETGLYYLQSRYYNAEWGRFINADAVDITIDKNEDILSANLFTYCTNNPVNYLDDNGEWKIPVWGKIVIGAAAIAVGVAATAITGGAALPVLAASLKIAAISAASGAAKEVISNRISTGSWKGSGKAVLNGGATGFMMGGISAGATFTTAAAKGVQILEIGKLKPPANKKGQSYRGIKYSVPKGKGYSTRSFEFHSPHKNGKHKVYHWQKNQWNKNKITNIWTVNSKKSKYWRWWGKKI